MTHENTPTSHSFRLPPFNEHIPDDGFILTPREEWIDNAMKGYRNPLILILVFFMHWPIMVFDYFKKYGSTAIKTQIVAFWEWLKERRTAWIAISVVTLVILLIASALSGLSNPVER